MDRSLRGALWLAGGLALTLGSALAVLDFSPTLALSTALIVFGCWSLVTARSR